VKRFNLHIGEIVVEAPEGQDPNAIPIVFQEAFEKLANKLKDSFISREGSDAH
jgi:hypothetical protein